MTNANGDNIPPYACTYSGISSEGFIAVVADEDGQLTILDTTQRTPVSIISQWQCHSNAVFDVRWLPGERSAITASGDQTLGLHDLITRTKITSFVGHSSSVRAVDFQVGNPHVLVSASRDGSIRLWDRRNRKTMKRRGVCGLTAVACLPGCHQSQNGPTTMSPSVLRGFRSSKSAAATRGENSRCEQSVTSVSFGEDFIASSGSTDGKIKLWDLRKMNCRGVPSPKFVFPYSGESRKTNIGYSHLFVDYLRSRLFGICRDQTIYQYSLTLQSDRPVLAYRGHQSSSFYIRGSLSPDGQFLACGSGDCNAYIYAVNERHKTATMLRGFEGEVTDVRWSPYDPTIILSLSDDCWVRVWKMNRRKEVSSSCGDFWGMSEPCSHSVTYNSTPSSQSSSIFRKSRPSLGNEEVPSSSCGVRQLNLGSFLTSNNVTDLLTVTKATPPAKQHFGNTTPRKIAISLRKSIARCPSPSSDDRENETETAESNTPLPKRRRSLAPKQSAANVLHDIQCPLSRPSAEPLDPRCASPQLPKRLRKTSRLSRSGSLEPRHQPITNFFSPLHQ